MIKKLGKVIIGFVVGVATILLLTRGIKKTGECRLHSLNKQKTYMVRR